MEEKKVSKVKAVICFIITLVTVYIMYNMVLVFIEWASQQNPQIKNQDLLNILKFLGVLLANIINGVVATFEFKKGHDPDKMSFIKYIFRSPFFLNGIFVWMLFISLLVPSVFIIALLILGLILGYKGGSSKNRGSSGGSTVRNYTPSTSSVSIRQSNWDNINESMIAESDRQYYPGKICPKCHQKFTKSWDDGPRTVCKCAENKYHKLHIK